MDIYEPAEDSYLLQKFVEKFAKGRVLDMGTGSGIQAKTAAKNPFTKEVIAVDINENAINNLKNLNKIKPIKSDLFENVYGSFDLIIFNAPYLPQDEGIEDLALYGGIEGWEISKRFFSKVSKYLIKNGKILYLFSSLTKKNKIDEILNYYLFEFTQLAREKHAFETLYVYKIKKSYLLRFFEGCGLNNISYLAKGKRGIVYQGLFDLSTRIKSHFEKKNDVKVAIKIQNEQTQAKEVVEKEAKNLRLVNKYNIGPKYYFKYDNFLVMELVEGKLILEWIKKNSKEKIINLLTNILEQCYILDKLGVSKEEMHRSIKHIIVTKENKPIMIDFERLHKTDKPKNVTQFVEYVTRIKEFLCFELDVEELRKIVSIYKNNFSRENFDKILTCVGKEI